MSERSVTHATFVIERTYAASPARVFAAWADPAAKARWFAGPDEWQPGPHELDFRVGGRERVSGVPRGGPVHTFEARYHDIVPNERIISSYDMYMDETRISASLATVELQPAGDGTRLIYTEQGAFLDGYDDPALREHGTAELLDALGAALAREHANA
ncbi:MAG TPA: SRPBCC family protein [Dehalococcoidia bacterium]|nr:SRPBCC family protein [Dehalococcoidia bacterium]